MKKLLVSAALLALLPLVPARADTVVLLDSIYDGGLQGGEFTAITSANGVFTTFCLEYTSPVVVAFPYDYTISNAAVTGGLNHVSTPGYDTLSQGSAYLYTLFHFNQLSGYSATSALHDLNAGYLQKAFWALEDELTFSSAGGTKNPYLALAVNKFGSFANAQKDFTGTEVKVMNIDVNPSQPDGLAGVHRQDQLIYVPDGGTTVALFGFALLVLGALRFRLA